MDPHITEWLNLAIRWVHMIVGIAWIGASFYFVWLENNLNRVNPKTGLSGDLWAIHGGGIYHLEKYKLAPPQMPENLHWFKWEAYFTWITGFALLSLLYYGGASLYLVDPAVMDLSPAAAIAISLGSIGFGWIAYDLILQAESGFMSMNGTKDSGPVKMPVAFIDLFAAHQLKEGILVALLKQQQSPGALKVEVSLYDAALASLANQATNWLMAKHLPKRIGSKHPNIAPYGELFVTEDKKLVTFAIGSNRQFKELCHELGADEILTNNKFQENHSRVEHRSELAELLKQYVLKRGADELIQKLTEKYVPTAKIKDLSEVLSEEGAQRLVLEEVVNEQMTRRLKSAVFTIRS